MSETAMTDMDRARGLMAGIAVGNLLGIAMEGWPQRRIALIDFTGQVGEEVARRMQAAGYDLETVDAQVGLEELDRRVLEDEIEAYIVLDDLTVREGAFAYRSKDSPGRVRGALMESIVVETVLELRLSFTENTAGVRELLGGGHLSFERLGEVVSEVEEISGIATGFAGVFILYLSMLLYGQFVLRSVLDEKRNRVVEVVISAVTPGRLMLGKILGVGSMGMTQLGIWAACAALIGLLGVPMLAARPAPGGPEPDHRVASRHRERWCCSWSTSCWGSSSTRRSSLRWERCAARKRRRNRRIFR